MDRVKPKAVVSSGGGRAKKEFIPSLAAMLLNVEKIEEESVDGTDFDDDYNPIAVISPFTGDANHAYWLADEYRKRGKTVIGGGMHATFTLEEALQHYNAVVIGEAEGLWQQILEDFRNGNLKRVYKHPTGKFPSLEGIRPNRELVDPSKYIFTTNVVQMTRGCPFGCTFCSVTSFFGGKYRMRPVDEVVAEIKGLKDPRVILFVDDNIAAVRDYTMDVLAQMPKRKWYGQARITVADDEELLKAMKKSGCKGLFIGFETLNPDSINEMKKGKIDTSRYPEQIEKIHSYGIKIVGSFPFGFDNDDSSVFKETTEFALKYLDLANFAILTPLPGTGLYKKLESEGRIIVKDWSKYGGMHAVFQPAKMSPEELQKGFFDSYKGYYRFWPSLLRSGFDWDFFRLNMVFYWTYREKFKVNKLLDEIWRKKEISIRDFIDSAKRKKADAIHYIAEKSEDISDYIAVKRGDFATKKEEVVARLRVPYGRLKIPKKYIPRVNESLRERLQLQTGLKVYLQQQPNII